MARRDDQDLSRIAKAITDKTPVDWDAERSAHPELSLHLTRLRLIERIADFHRARSATPPIKARRPYRLRPGQ